MRVLVRSCIAAVVLAGLAGIAAPVAAQRASVTVQIGTPGYHYRSYYRHGYRAQRHWHGHRAYGRHYRPYARYYGRPVVVVAPRAHYRAHSRRYSRWY